MPGSPHCARPGCDGAVAAWLTYDYAASTVWLDDRDRPVGGSRLGLCPAHAGRPPGAARLDPPGPAHGRCGPGGHRFEPEPTAPVAV